MTVYTLNPPASRTRFDNTAALIEALGISFSTEQLDAITAPLEPGVIIAGAGSGKTTVMAARVVWLVGTGAVRPEEGLAGAVVGNVDEMPVGSCCQQRLHQQDQPYCAAEIDLEALIEILVGHVRRGRERRGVGGGVHHEIETTPALADRHRQALHAGLVGERKRHQRRVRSASGDDRVGQFLETTYGAGECHHLMALGAKPAGDGIAETPARAGDEGDRS